MSIDLIPSVPVALSLGACLLLPAILLALSHGPLRISSPGMRFVVAASGTWSVWCLAMAAVVPGWVDLITGGLLLATATLAGFTLWTLIAWGFTLSMLLALQRAQRPLPIAQWAIAYTRGKPLDAFARDRLGVLLMLGLGEVRGGSVVMTPRSGSSLALMVSLLRSLFGLPR